METAIGVVRLRPAPDYDRLRAVMHEDPREVIPQARHFLSHAAKDDLTRARTYNLMCYTSACVLKRSDPEAVLHGEEAVRLSRGLAGAEGARLLFDSLVNLGTAAERIGEYSRAIAVFQEALSLPLPVLDRAPHEEAVLCYLGRVHYYRGDYGEALAAFDRAEALALRRQDPTAGESLYSQRGRCYMKMGELAEAEAYLSRAAAVTNNETRYELRPKGRILAGMAVLKALSREYGPAEEYARGALEIALAVGDPHGQVEGQMVLALCARGQRFVQESVRLSAEASRIAFEYGYVPLIQEAAWLMGQLYPCR